MQLRPPRWRYRAKPSQVLPSVRLLPGRRKLAVAEASTHSTRRTGRCPRALRFARSLISLATHLYARRFFTLTSKGIIGLNPSRLRALSFTRSMRCALRSILLASGDLDIALEWLACSTEPDFVVKRASRTTIVVHCVQAHRPTTRTQDMHTMTRHQCTDDARPCTRSPHAQFSIVTWC